MARILVVERIAPAGLAMLAASHQAEVRLNLARPELLAAVAADGGWDALVVRSQTRVDAELFAAAAPRLSVVAVASVGTDRVDLEAAAAARVTVVNAPTGSTVAAAEHTMALLLALLRKIPSADASVRRGEWERARYVGSELQHRTLGIIGLGKIGREVARRAAAFEMRVIAHDPFLAADQAGENVSALVELPELLALADVVSIHVTLTPQTRGLIGQAQIASMKQGAVLVNVARGGLVDETALAAALNSGHLSGAAIDVFTTEPMTPDNPLRDAPNTILTPHIGASTAEAQERAGVEMAERLLEALAKAGPDPGRGGSA
jgi:D-3-phosphoglycerate dehydrogenase / 2-oxoglutarate reductase